MKHSRNGYKDVVLFNFNMQLKKLVQVMKHSRNGYKDVHILVQSQYATKEVDTECDTGKTTVFT